MATKNNGSSDKKNIPANESQRDKVQRDHRINGGFAQDHKPQSIEMAQPRRTGGGSSGGGSGNGK